MGELMAQYKVGTLVENKGAPQWGPGKIVHITGEHLHILFRDAEGNAAKKFAANAPALRLAVLQSDPILDNLPPLIEKDGSWIVPGRSLTLESARQKFLHWFPTGFAAAKYRSEERDYKMDAHNRIRALFEEGRQLLQADVEEFATKVLAVLSPVHLLSTPFEMGAFHDAMQDSKAARSFFTALLALLDSPSVDARFFEQYATAVCCLPARRGRVATWPVATVLPFLARPDIHMFLKPQVTKRAAESLGFDLKFDSTPNWKTYEALLRMAKTYLDLLRPLGAIDFLDVYSFFFISGGGYDDGKPSKGAPEIVLKVGAEGGTLTLMRATDAGKQYHFWMECNESTLSDFLVDGEQIDADDLRSKSGVVDSLEEAFRLLDRYPYWPSLFPLEVHPDLRSEILREVNRKAGVAEEKRWITRLQCL